MKIKIDKPSTMYNGIYQWKVQDQDHQTNTDTMQSASGSDIAQNQHQHHKIKLCCNAYGLLQRRVILDNERPVNHESHIGVTHKSSDHSWSLQGDWNTDMSLGTKQLAVKILKSKNKPKPDILVQFSPQVE